MRTPHILNRDEGDHLHLLNGDGDANLYPRKGDGGDHLHLPRREWGCPPPPS